MLPVRVLALPSLLLPEHLTGRVAVVFDVLRATTTIAAAISAGVTEIEVFGSRADARAARQSMIEKGGKPLLAGEENAVKPADFDLGNSPEEFTAERCAGRTILMATTNGTKALVAARSADVLLTGALANITATAAAIRRTGLPVTLIGSGTQGEVSLEDLIGCGAVMDHLGDIVPENDTAHLALTVWRSARMNLPAVFRETFSGHNLKRAGLLTGLDFCTQIDRYAIACRVFSENTQLVVRRWVD